jgi:hypothetical protein
MRANIRRKTKCIYFKIINETAKAAGGQHYADNDEYVIAQKNTGPLPLSPIKPKKYRF